MSQNSEDTGIAPEFPHPARAALAQQQFVLRTTQYGMTAPQVRAEQTGVQRPGHVGTDVGLAEFQDRRTLVQAVPPVHREMHDRHVDGADDGEQATGARGDRESTRLNSSKQCASSMQYSACIKKNHTSNKYLHQSLYT